ncbi:hypothetical protein LJC63_09855, partial [Ruminococcaceae bacterium OttesenSCG-928-L11]|nr:hypothetical protein [Ruminococcaceae bacterium OttesenSCG-928-L11]
AGVAAILAGAMAFPASAYTADKEILTKKMQDALKPGQVTYARLYDIDKVDKADLQYVAQDMTAKRGKVFFEFCSLQNKEVVARMVVNPNLVKDGEGSIDPYIALSGEGVDKVREKFTKHFGKDVAVIGCGTVDFGMTVVLSAKLDFGTMNTSSLKAYAYDSSANAYTAIKDTDFVVDENGFLHFQTQKAGYIIVTQA